MTDLISSSQIELINLLIGILGDYGKHSESKKELTFNCPVCREIKISEGLLSSDSDGDNKFNLEISYGKGIYNCWACGKTHQTHGTLFDLVQKFGTDNDLAEYRALKLSYEYITSDLKERTNHDIYLPAEFISLTGKRMMKVYRGAFEYLDRRKITDEIIKKYNIGWCYAGKYENRILIPSIVEYENEDGEIREKVDYFATRAYLPNIKPKYLNCDKERELIVFNESLIDWNKTVFVVEGPFDHIVTPNSLPMLGKDFYPLLKKTIYNNANSNVVILTDPDAQERGVQIYRELDGGKLLGRVFINFLPAGYDPAKFFEIFGFEAYKNQLKKSIRLVD